MNIIRWLVEAFNPCIHIDKPVAVMHDRPVDPRRTTTITQCEICGRVKSQRFVADGPCNKGLDHEWHTLSKVALYKTGSKSERPIGEVFVQKCQRCGDMRRLDMVSDSRKAEQKKEEAA